MWRTITTLIATSTLGLAVTTGVSFIGSSPALAQDGCGCSCYTYTSAPANVTKLCEDDAAVLVRKLSAKGVKISRKDIVCSREIYPGCTGGSDGGIKRKITGERGRVIDSEEKMEGGSGGGGGGGGAR